MHFANRVTVKKVSKHLVVRFGFSDGAPDHPGEEVASVVVPLAMREAITARLIEAAASGGLPWIADDEEPAEEPDQTLAGLELLLKVASEPKPPAAPKAQ